MTIATIFAQQVHAQYYSVNFDAKTVAAMVAAYGTGTCLLYTSIHERLSAQEGFSWICV